MALRYEVRHSFARGDKYFTRDNADDVKSLPRADRDELISRGYIAEYNDAESGDTTRGSAATKG